MKRAPALPPEIVRERAAILSALDGIVPMLAAMVGDHVEVVLHDLTRPESSVRRIANGHITGRRPGSPVLEGPGNDKALAILAAGMEAAGPLEHVDRDVAGLLDRGDTRLGYANPLRELPLGKTRLFAQGSQAGGQSQFVLDLSDPRRRTACSQNLLLPLLHAHYINYQGL